MKPAIALVVLLLTLSCGVGSSWGQTTRESLKVAAAVAPEWPKENVTIGKTEIQVIVTTDGYFGNVVQVEPKGPHSIFSQPCETAARLWKFFPSKPNSKQTLTFVLEVFAKGDHTRRAMTTFIPPYKVVTERPDSE